MKLGFLGTGTIASAVVRGIAPDGHQITVSQRSTEYSGELSAAFDNVAIADNQGVLDQSDVVFLGLMAPAAPDILASLVFRPDHKVVTFMAGATLDEVSAMVAPAKAEAIMMPFPGIAKGGSAIIAQGQARLIDSLFGKNNTVFHVETADEMAAYLSAQAVLSPVARMVDDAANWLADRVSDPIGGETFLRVLVSSSLAGSACAPLIEALNTPGGYNQRLRLHMEQSGMGKALVEGLDQLESGT